MELPDTPQLPIRNPSPFKIGALQHLEKTMEDFEVDSRYSGTSQLVNPDSCPVDG
jgi:hypothetical protein